MAEGSPPDSHLRWRHCETPGVKTLCNLGRLLNKLEKGHREDIALHTSGHLNPNRLFRPPEAARGHWRSAHPPRAARGARGAQAAAPRAGAQAASMEEALAYFAVSTALRPDHGPGSALSRYLSPAAHPSEDDVLAEPQLSAGAAGAARRGREELQWPRLKVLQPRARGSGAAASPPRKDKYRYVNNYLAGLTKADAYGTFLWFQRRVLAAQDLRGGDSTGRTAALRHERKLEQELQKACVCDPQGRLQVFSRVFEDICNSSWIFGDILKEIKDEYELYLAILLHAWRPEQHQTLQAHAEGLERRPVRTEDVRQARRELRALVMATKAALEHNDRLRSELAAERALLRAAEETPKSPEKNVTEEEHLTLVDKVERKRCEILKKLDEIQALETEMKTTLVHTGILHITENRMKSIETEAIKLERANAILMRKINIAERQAQQRLGRAQPHAEQQQNLWKFIEEYVTLKETDDNSQLTGEMTYET